MRQQSRHAHRHIEAAVLERLGGKTLRPAVVMAVLDGVTAKMAPKASARTVEKLRADVQDAVRALSNLSKAIAAGRRLDSLVAELAAGQVKRERLLAMMTSHERTAGQRIDRRAIEQAMKRHTDRRRSLLTNLRGHPAMQPLNPQGFYVCHLE